MSRVFDSEFSSVSPNYMNDWMPPEWNPDQDLVPQDNVKSLHVKHNSEDQAKYYNCHKSTEGSCSTAQSSYELIVVKQPEEQHRARYLSEGSRGAIKDRSGSSHCTIKLTGFHRPTRVEMYAVNGSGATDPHPFYKLIPVSGKSATTTPCKKNTSRDGIECIEVVLRPENNMTAVLDCIGILKICAYNNKQRRQRRNTNFEGENCGVISTRICFRAYVLDSSEHVQVISVCTEPIRCVQQLGVPEVLKMSLSRASSLGGMEMFIIGRNFDRNTSVLFREYTDSGSLCWSAEAEIQRAFFHQCHIVCTVPPYPNRYRGGTVSVTVKCGAKHSHPSTFIYQPCEEEVEDEWCPPGSPRTSLKRSWCQANQAHWEPPNSFDMPFFEHEPRPSHFYATLDEPDELRKKRQ